jgi:hypothetical protein
MVCIQPMLVYRARECEDFTKDGSDFKDAKIIARLAAELRWYVPDAPEGHWCRLRHLGARRNALLVDAETARQALANSSSAHGRGRSALLRTRSGPSRGRRAGRCRRATGASPPRWRQSRVSHRLADRLVKQVDEHEVAPGGTPLPVALDEVLLVDGARAELGQTLPSHGARELPIQPTTAPTTA